MCSVMPEVLTSDWKKCSTSCVSYLPIRSVGSARSQLHRQGGGGQRQHGDCDAALKAGFHSLFC